MVSDQTQDYLIKPSNKDKLFWIVLSLLIINLIILDIKLFTPPAGPDEIAPGFQELPKEAASPTAPMIESDLCPAVCLEAMTRATASSLIKTTPMPKTVVQPEVKEFYIPLGSGSTKSQDWIELVGIESVVDMDNYQNVKAIIFEASMRIPTANGKVYAKLYNVTDKHDVWYSEVEVEGSSGYRAESANLTLSPGRKLYRVMMKSTMAYEAILDSARIKILLE